MKQETIALICYKTLEDKIESLKRPALLNMHDKGPHTYAWFEDSFGVILIETPSPGRISSGNIFGSGKVASISPQRIKEWESDAESYGIALDKDSEWKLKVISYYKIL